MTEIERQRRTIRVLAAIAVVAALGAVWATWQMRAARTATEGGAVAGLEGTGSVQEGSGVAGGVGNGGAGGTGGTGGTPVDRLRGFRAEPPMPAEDFTLTRTDGSPFTLSDRKGQIVMVFFGYTKCPDVCPLTLSWLAGGMEKLGPDADNVTVVFISVDPERDTPEVIDKYLAGFDERFIGVTGTIPQLEKVVASYNSSFFKQVDEHEHAAGEPTDHAHDAYLMAHPAEVFVIDQAGLLREFFSTHFTPEEVEHDVRMLLAEG